MSDIPTQTHVCGCRTTFNLAAWDSIPLRACKAHEKDTLSHIEKNRAFWVACGVVLPKVLEVVGHA